MDEEKQEKKESVYSIGIIIFFLLSILTLLEYVVAVYIENAIILLFVIAFLKAALILQVFMHISSLWSEEGH